MWKLMCRDFTWFESDRNVKFTLFFQVPERYIPSIISGSHHLPRWSHRGLHVKHTLTRRPPNLLILRLCFLDMYSLSLKSLRPLLMHPHIRKAFTDYSKWNRWLLSLTHTPFSPTLLCSSPQNIFLLHLTYLFVCFSQLECQLHESRDFCLCCSLAWYPRSLWQWLTSFKHWSTNWMKELNKPIIWMNVWLFIMFSFFWVYLL